ncbi:capsular polysaccharide export protein, LipB/KpsS family [Sphingomonas quercus]|uniref:capsular polysaccharide export protein, LipB/KpsS family n=1 Tax=Sphingomonas quercus TaxID=2842451 RepID=UPI00341ED231
MTPLLRSPPFPGVAPAVAAISHPAARPVADDPGRLEALVASIAATGVAGSFWRDQPAADAREARLIAAIAAGDAGADGLAEALLGPAYRDPFSGEAIAPEQAVAILGHWRAVIEANRGIRAAAGMAWWKRRAIARFLWSGEPLAFVRSAAAARAAAGQGAVAVWPSRAPAGLGEAGLPIVSVEDGFIRSIGLGSDLHPPFSIVVDRSGIHYDPSRPSDLETILQTAEFTDDLLARAGALAEAIVAGGISKYAVSGATAPRAAADDDGRRVVLVPGQVEDDMSVRLGGAGIRSNVELLARARAAEPDARILFKPHPDVDAGHRPGRVPDAAILAHADEIVRGEAMPALLARVDAVHVLTSLTGFEALLRGLPVTTHGQPFFAGWGLTTDLAGSVARRTRRLTAMQLIAGVLILYPRYMDPVTGLPCPAEVLVRRFAEQARPSTTMLVRARRLQGRLVRAYRFRRQGT